MDVPGSVWLNPDGPKSEQNTIVILTLYWLSCNIVLPVDNMYNILQSNITAQKSDLEIKHRLCFCAAVSISFHLAFVATLSPLNPPKPTNWDQKGFFFFCLNTFQDYSLDCARFLSCIFALSLMCARVSTLCTFCTLAVYCAANQQTVSTCDSANCEPGDHPPFRSMPC